jgi:hypothetical protein
VSKRAVIKKQNPDLKTTEISRILGMMWKEASEEEKQPFIEREEVEREVYKAKMNEWKRQQEEMQDQEYSSLKSFDSNDSYEDEPSTSGNSLQGKEEEDHQPTKNEASYPGTTKNLPFTNHDNWPPLMQGTSVTSHASQISPHVSSAPEFLPIINTSRTNPWSETHLPQSRSHTHQYPSATLLSHHQESRQQKQTAMSNFVLGPHDDPFRFSMQQQNKQTQQEDKQQQQQQQRPPQPQQQIDQRLSPIPLFHNEQEEPSSFPPLYHSSQQEPRTTSSVIFTRDHQPYGWHVPQPRRPYHHHQLPTSFNSIHYPKTSTDYFSTDSYHHNLKYNHVLFQHNSELGCSPFGSYDEYDSPIDPLPIN